MKLPYEVLKMLGDDATPEAAAVEFDEWVENDVSIVRTEASDAPRHIALSAYRNALAAAAIRAMECAHEWNSHGNVIDKDAAQVRWNEAYDQYAALRTRPK